MTTDTDKLEELFDWESDREPSRLPHVGFSTLAFLLGLTVLGAAFGYYSLAVFPGPLVAGWYVSGLEWLVLLSVLAFSCYVLVPLARNPQSTARRWRRFRRNRLAVAALASLVVLCILSVVVPAIIGKPSIDMQYNFQPPFPFVTRSNLPNDCVGPVFNYQCVGTPVHPLGTNHLGRDMFFISLAGMRVALEVALVTSMLIVPLATVVGVTAGYAGGTVDSLLMGVVDVVEVLPAFVVYIILIFVFGRSLFLIVLVFGLFSWGGVARVVRGEVLQLRSEPYVTAARSAGASRFAVVRRHVIPNVSSPLVTATTAQIPIIILSEAAISFLGLGDVDRLSWGTSIYNGLTNAAWTTSFLDGWWLTVVPVLFLTLTVLAISVLGDALRDTLDPRGDG